MTATGGFPVSVGCVLLTDSARLPSMGSPFSVGYDIYPNHPMTIDGYDRCLVTTGLCLDIPLGFYGCIYPRSSLVLYSGITIIPFCLDAGLLRFVDPPPHVILQSNYSQGGDQNRGSESCIHLLPHNHLSSHWTGRVATVYGCNVSSVA